MQSRNKREGYYAGWCWGVHRRAIMPAPIAPRGRLTPTFIPSVRMMKAILREQKMNGYVDFIPKGSGKFIYGKRMHRKVVRI